MYAFFFCFCCSSHFAWPLVVWASPFVCCQLNDSLQPFNNPIYEKRPEAYPKHLYLMHKSAKSNTTGGNLVFFHHLTERFMPHLPHFF